MTVRQKIRIVHVVPTLGTGGTEQNGLRLTRFLAQNDHFEAHIIANFPGDESLRPVFAEASSHPITVLAPGRLARMSGFYSAVRGLQPTAVVFHFFNVDQALMMCVARLAGARRCVASAGTAATDLSRWALSKWKAALILNWITRTPIVLASHWIKVTFENMAQLPRGSRVVHNGIELEKFNNARDIKANRQADSGRWTLGMVARLDGAKDHETLLHGFRKFIDLIPNANAELRLIGDGPLRADLESLVNGLNLSEYVSFLGTRLDVPEQLAELDAFVFSTTRKEGFGNVLIEALAAGVPVLANDVPSSREVLRDGEFGTLVPSDGPDAWAAALSRTYHNGPANAPPSLEKVEVAYGIEQFCNGYLTTLGLET